MKTIALFKEKNAQLLKFDAKRQNLICISGTPAAS